MEQKRLDALSVTIGDHYRGQVPRVAEQDAFGLEIELEGLQGEPYEDFGERLQPGAAWRVVHDGSLRDGAELVNNGPQAYSDLRAGLTRLNERFGALGFTPQFTFRTSLHVHMNATHMTWKEIINLYVLYVIFEEPLFLMGGEERKGNVHCLGAEASEQQVQALRTALVADIIPDTEDTVRYGRPAFHQLIQGVTGRDRRYASFNFASLAQHGTIEFRSHRGTADTTTIMNWVDVVRSMRDYARTAVDNPIEIIQRLSRLGAVGFGREVFPAGSPIHGIILGHQRDVQRGMRLAQEVAFARQNWSVKAPKKPKEAPKVAAQDLQWNNVNWAPVEEDVAALARQVRQDQFQAALQAARNVGVRRGPQFPPAPEEQPAQPANPHAWVDEFF